MKFRIITLLLQEKMCDYFLFLFCCCCFFFFSPAVHYPSPSKPPIITWAICTIFFCIHRCHRLVSLDEVEMESASLSCASLVLCPKTQQSIMCQREDGSDSILFTQVYPQNYSDSLSLELLNSQSIILTILWQADRFINYNELY